MALQNMKKQGFIVNAIAKHSICAFIFKETYPGEFQPQVIPFLKTPQCFHGLPLANSILLGLSVDATYFISEPGNKQMI